MKYCGYFSDGQLRSFSEGGRRLYPSCSSGGEHSCQHPQDLSSSWIPWDGGMLGVYHPPICPAHHPIRPCCSISFSLQEAVGRRRPLVNTIRDHGGEGVMRAEEEERGKSCKIEISKLPQKITPRQGYVYYWEHF